MLLLDTIIAMILVETPLSKFLRPSWTFHLRLWYDSNENFCLIEERERERRKKRKLLVCKWLLILSKKKDLNKLWETHYILSFFYISCFLIDIHLDFFFFFDVYIMKSIMNTINYLFIFLKSFLLTIIVILFIKINSCNPCQFLHIFYSFELLFT